MKTPGDPHQKKCTKMRYGEGGVVLVIWGMRKKCLNDTKMRLFCVMILDIFDVVPLAGTWIETLLAAS